jgi:hypothetical protein
LEDEVNVAVKLRRPDADELVAAMAAKHAKAQEALLHVPNPPSNMVPTHTIANAGNNKTATTNEEIIQSGSGSCGGGGGSNSSTFSTLGDRLWRRTGALHLIMNCTAGTSEEAFEALAEVFEVQEFSYTTELFSNLHLVTHNSIDFSLRLKVLHVRKSYSKRVALVFTVSFFSCTH